MPRQLIVEFIASTSKYQADLGRAASAAESTAKRIDRTFSQLQSTVRTALGAAAGAFSITEVIGWAKETVAAAAALDDLSDATGSSVEALSKLQNQAKISGADFSVVTSLVQKLAAGMAGVDDESSNVGRALKALGVESRDPAQAIQEVAVKLNQYADGIGKAALARDLFGKGGVAFLATLKDIANNQDVLATVTAQQAAEAERLEQAWRRLSTEGSALKTTLLSDVVPAIANAIEQFREGIEIAGGFLEAIRAFGTINPFKATEQNLADVTRRLENFQNGTLTAETFNARLFGTEEELKRRLSLQKQFLEFQVRQAALARSAAAGASNFDARDYLAQRKPALDYTGTKEKAGASVRQVDDFARALERVREAAGEARLELRSAFSGEELFPAEKALERIKNSDVWQKFSDAQKSQLAAEYESVVAIEKETAAWKKKREETEKQIKALQEVEAQQQKAKDAVTEALGAYGDMNTVLARELAIVGEDELAHKKLAATLEFEKLERQAIAADDKSALEALRTQFSERMRLIGQYDAVVKALAKSEEMRRIFTDNFAMAVTDVVTGTKSISDAFKQMERSIIASISNIASQNIANALFGKGTYGGGFTDWLAGLFSGGGGGATSMPWSSTTMDPFGFFGLPGMASGGMLTAGQPAVVGEKGPELFIPKTSGNVVPNDVLRAKRASRGNITINVNVPPSTTRSTADQIAVQTARAVNRAIYRNA